MVWWAWSAYAWMTNAIDVENTVTRLIIFAAMAAGFFMALAVPDAFQDEAAWFAVAYFVVRVLNSTLYAWGVRDDPGPAPRGRSARAVVPRRGARRADRRLRRSGLPRVDLARLARHRRRRDAHGRARRVARLAVALRRALRADRDHRARRVDRRDRDRDVRARARRDVRALGGRRVRRRRGAVVGVLRLHGGRGRARAATRVAGRSRAARARRLHLLPLPGRARDHLLRRRGEEDARAPARPAVGGGSVGARARRRDLPLRLRADAVPRRSADRLGAARRGRRSRSSSPSRSTARTRS